MQVNAATTRQLDTPSVGRQKYLDQGDVSMNAASVSSSSTQVTLSSSARQLAELDQSGRSREFQARTIQNAKDDPSLGDKWAQEFATSNGYETSGPLVDISALPTIRYTYTGEVVTDQNLAAFKAEAAQARTDMTAIYDTEKAKGTQPSAILEKLYQYTDTRSDGYLSKLGWARQADGGQS